MKIFVIFIVTFSILFVIYLSILDQDDPFLSFLRYKEYQVEHKKDSYNFELINRGDSTFYYRIDYHTSSIKRTITWFGDTINTIPSHGSGYYQPKNISELFTGYDTSVVKFSDNMIVPLNPGTTNVILKYPTRIDTIKIYVNLIGEQLVVKDETYNNSR